MAAESQDLPVEAGGRFHAVAAWRQQTSPVYQALFLAALLVLGGSFVAGFFDGVRWFGLPPIDGDATILGRTLLERQEYAAALEEFRLAGLIDPENYDVPLQLSFSPAPSAPENIERLLRWARENPQSAGAQLTLGQEQLAQGDVAASLESLELARAIDPRERGLAATLGRAYLVSGRYGESESALREALASAPNAELHDLLGFALYQQGRRAEAIEHFETARALRAQRAERIP